MNRSINELEQHCLDDNVVLNGIPEIKSNKGDLDAIARDVLNNILPSIYDKSIISIKRIDQADENNNATKCTPIVVKLDSKIKPKILKARSQKRLNRSLIKLKGSKIGNENDKVYVDEHLNRKIMQLLLKARGLRRSGLISLCCISIFLYTEGKAWLLNSPSSWRAHPSPPRSFL